MVLVGVRPRRIPEWVWAAAGAVVLLLAGAEPLRAALAAVGAQWNVLLFILALMAISASCEAAGVFEWIADAILERGGGSRRRLFVVLFAAGAALTIVLSNDATAIVFTPIVYRAIAKRGIAVKPYLYACTFVADTASFGLPFSNPANLLVIPRPQLVSFVMHLGPPMALALAINLGVFLVVFRSALDGTYAPAAAVQPTRRVRDTLVAMLLVAAAYVVALLYDVPLGPVALAGAVLVALVANSGVRTVARSVAWPTLGLLAGMFVLLDAVTRQGAVPLALAGLRDAAHDGRLFALLAATFGSALASNLLNNLPVAVISGTIVSHGGFPTLAYPFVAGVDLGPNLTTTGSLATILWLSAVRARGVDVSPLEYLRLGLAVVPAMLLTTTLWLWFVG
ncbi:MAG: arsenic transporter [Candidatus Eremiobacteraeota bacterium]|nr:arsenic transporter [Candidatus Eremiobacteraeota bacterium]